MLTQLRQRRSGRLWIADFTALPAGACSVLPAMLLHTRGSGATVQTGTSSVVTGLGVDVAGIGRALDADALGLVIDEGRTNLWSQSGALATSPWQKQTGTETLTNGAATDPSGGSAATSLTSASAGLYGVKQVVTWASATTYAWSHWHRAISGTSVYRKQMPLVVGSSNTVTGDLSVGTAWAMQELIAAVTTGGSTSGALFNSVGQAAWNAYLWGAQLEAGKFRTEYIPTTTASLARSGARIWHPYSALVVDRGRLALDLSLQPKGATTDYAADPYIWRVDASNYATLSKTDGKATIVIAGASYTTASGFTWAAGDSVDLWIEAGGSAIQSVVKARKNGGSITTLGTSTSPQAALPASGALDLFQNGSGASVLSARYRKFAPWASGYRAGWAA